MERASSKHSPRLDEEMSREVRGLVEGTPGGRAEEWATPEPPGDDQPDVTARLDESQSEAFSRFGRYIGRSALPGDRRALRHAAEALNAPDDVLADLDRLPPDVVFATVTEIWDVLDR